MTGSHQRDGIVVGACWRHKRDRFRTVRIFHVATYDGQRHASVVRNTSRRTQAISETTLLRDYEPIEVPAS